MSRFDEYMPKDLRYEVREWRGYRMWRSWMTNIGGVEREHTEECIVYLADGQRPTREVETAVAKAWMRP